MKIYTEVIYFWDDDKGELVQESSKSYDYDGPLTLANGSEFTQSAEYLQYPNTLGSEVNHWISFTAFDFKSKFNTLDIALYIPGDALTTSYKSEYESVGLGMMGAAGAGALDAITKVNPDAKEGMLKGVTDFIGALKTNIRSEGKGAAMIELGRLASGISGASGAKTIMEQKTGAVLNPYIVAAYKGPSDMRTHDFTFQMLPQSIQESKACVKIASAFKTAMLPSFAGGNSPSAPSMLFGYPDEFEIRFAVNGEEMPFNANNPMFNIGRSVLTSCDLDFATESVALFFDETQYPVSISMKLSFMELEVLHRGKIDDGF
jgi:hypothetical protein